MGKAIAKINDHE